MTRLSEMLDRKAEDIKRPPILPAGIYEAQVAKAAEFDERTSDFEGGTTWDIVRFPCKVTGAIEVDEDDLEAYGKVEGAPFRHEFLINTRPDKLADAERTMFSLRLFLEALGVMDDSTELGEAIAASPGASFGVELTHRNYTSQGEERVALNVRRAFVLD